jgi:hypothetical protein
MNPFFCPRWERRTLTVYRVDEDVVFVTVIAVGKRDRNRVYAAAQDRLA